MRNRQLPIAIGAVIAAAAALLLALPSRVAAAPRKHVNVDGNRTPAVHTIPLYDEEGEQIRSDDLRAKPFSTRTTCGDCHDYDAISMGWHFNSSAGNSPPGRPGEPWILIDDETGAQLPLSYRHWPDLWQPEEAGLTPWQFIKTFGRHMPGGDVGEKEEEVPNPNARWEISGRLEINCLACHSASPEQNQSEWVIQIARENFRWAATGASGLGLVRNVASRLPGSFDFIDGPNPDDRSWAVPPEVDYCAAKFNADQLVFFDVVRDPPPNRCYFCHSTVRAEADMDEKWQMDGDVHMATGGFTCTDCHGNSLDHSIVRGYEGESPDTVVASLSCEGCHLGEGDAVGLDAVGGHLGAPRPLHKGLPAVHLEEMTCTACHSGPLPGKTVGRVKTSRANRLGVHGKAQWDTSLPYIRGPVFARQADGKIAPQYMIWPAFWASVKDNKVSPLPLEVVAPFAVALRQSKKFAELEAEWKKTLEEIGQKELTIDADEAKAQAIKAVDVAAKATADAAGETTAENADFAKRANAAAAAAIEIFDLYLAEMEASEQGEADEETEVVQQAPAPEPEQEQETVEPLNKAEIAKLLAQLAEKAGIDGEPAYISNGKLYRFASEGALVAYDHEAAEPYAWSLGHDVRPASQSLGSGGCTDCHAPDAPFFFAEVVPDTPSQIGKPASVPMYAMQDLTPELLKAFETSAQFWSIYIAGGLILAGLLAAALFHYGFRGIEGMLRTLVATTAGRGRNG